MKRTLNAVILLLVCSVFAAAQSSPGNSNNPFIGKWRLNLERSTFDPGPAPTGHVEVLEVNARPDGWIVWTWAMINPNGAPAWNQGTVKIDGNDYPIYNKNALANHLAAGTELGRISFTRIDSSTVESVLKDANGMPTATRRRSVSADGSTLSDVRTGTNAQGQSFRSVFVYDRVP